MDKKMNRRIKLPTHIITSGILFLIQFAVMFAVIYNLTADSVVLYTILQIIGIATVIVIINRRGNPDHKIAWIVFILVFPIFGISVFTLWGGGRVAPHIKKNMRRCKERNLSYIAEDSEIHDRLKYYDITHSRQADYLTGESGYPMYQNSSVKYFSSGTELLPELLEELESAEKYIFIEFFIIAEGVMWDKIHSVLKRKAEQGVEIKILFDDFGSIKRQRKGFIRRLRNEGIEICAFNPINPIMNIFMNNRNHRKIVVVDGKTAVTGGINVGDEYIDVYKRFGKWVDSAVVIKGEAVKSFTVMFTCMWEFVNKTELDTEKYLCECSTGGKGFILPYEDGPLNDKNPAEGIYMQIINTAQRYVYIATPYLIIDNTMKSVLQMAAKSGVDVRIITPHIPDKWYVHPVTQYHYLELLEAGVKIYEYTPGFVHSKLFVSDDSITTVGSVNMDYRSFVFHFECGAWICDRDTVSDVKEHFLSVLSQSQEITLEEWKKRPFKDRFKQSVLHLLGPLM